MNWVEEIVGALEALGGTAKYADIYARLESTTTRNLGKEWRAVVRRTIEEHSSDTTCKKRPNFADLFYSVKGLGKGEWGLRSGAKRARSLRLQVVSDPKDIDRYQELFKKRFINGAKRLKRSLGSPGGESGNYTIYWNERESVWGTFQETPTRYWNPFGVAIPSPNQLGTMIIQVNPSRLGYHNTGGVFLKSSNSEDVFVAHRGDIGGTFSADAHLFFDRFKGPSIEAFEGGSAQRFAIVASLNDEDFQSRVADFVHEVARIKQSLKQKSDAGAYLPEFDGLRRGYNAGYVEAQCYHGSVVNALLAALEARGVNPSRDLHRDVFFPAKGECSALFEVKPTADRYSMYTGVGQLMINGSSGNTRPALVLVCPRPEQGIASAIADLGIHILTYEVSGNEVVFPNLDQIVGGSNRDRLTR